MRKMSQPDRMMMQRCFDLARNGGGAAAPNPLVGAVIAHGSAIIGEGWHEYFGGPHAEVNAVQSIEVKKKYLLPKSTLYVNLEPCNHFGKTPPCTELIIKSGIKKIIVSNLDPNPLVSGKGIARLKKAGCAVTTNFLEREGDWLNRRFFTFHRKKRPYIILKWAQSADGFFAKEPGKQQWITGKRSQRLVHRWRSEEAAILVGTNTALADNPQLTNRLWLKGKQPVRIIVDRQLRLPKNLHAFNADAPVIVFTERKGSGTKNIRYIQTEFGEFFLQSVMKELYQSGILSVLVEGGAQLLNDFIGQELWDEARILTGDVTFGSGIPAPVLAGKMISEENVGEDGLRILINPEKTISNNQLLTPHQTSNTKL